MRRRGALIGAVLLLAAAAEARPGPRAASAVPADTAAAAPAAALTAWQRTAWQRTAALALAEGGVTLFVRHEETDRTRADADPIDLDDCSTQRRLTAAGRARAAETGVTLRAYGVVVAEVLSSPMCRTRETARLLDLGPVRITPALYREPAPEVYHATRELLANPPAGGVRVVVSHTTNLHQAAGVRVPEGGGALFTGEDGAPRLLARIPVEDWAGLDTLSVAGPGG